MTSTGRWLMMMTTSVMMACLAQPAAARSVAVDTSDVSVNALSTSERDLRSSYIERQRLRDATIAGCATGAAVGAITGWLSKLDKDEKSNKEQKKRAILGGIAGCAVGALIGHARGRYVHAKAREYAADQDAERQLIAGLEEDITYYRAMNEKTAALINEESSKIEALNREYTAKVVSVEDYRARIAGREGNLKVLRDTILDASENIEVLNNDIAQLRAQSLSPAQFERKLGELHTVRASLIAQLQKLESSYATIPTSVTASQA
jgi:hypothetical protein